MLLILVPHLKGMHQESYRAWQTRLSQSAVHQTYPKLPSWKAQASQNEESPGVWKLKIKNTV